MTRANRSQEFLLPSPRFIDDVIVLRVGFPSMDQRQVFAAG